MNIIELRDKVKAGYNPTVRFTKRIEDYETYFDCDMKARIARIGTEENDMCEFVFDITESKCYNQTLERSNYYDENSEPCLTATQANLSPNKTESVYFTYDDVVADWFDIIGDDASVLFNHYMCNPDGRTYIQWLEQRVLKLEESVV